MCRVEIKAVSKSSISTFELFQRFPDQDSARALAKQAWEAIHRFDADAIPPGIRADEIAAIAAVYAPRLAELEAEVERLRRNVKGWVEWHRRCDADDDCTYLNDNAWCDAEALASTGMGLLARTALGASHDADA